VDQGATSDVVAEVDKAGFHQTETVDLVFVLDGDVTLVLDDGEVLLHRATACAAADEPAWVNENDRPIRLLALMIGAAGRGPAVRSIDSTDR
jgi:uncharacterized cupin superfamily protein